MRLALEIALGILAFNVAFFCLRVVVGYHLFDRETRRWLKLHPHMPLSRRGQR